MTDALIVDGVRSPRGASRKGNGALSGVHPQRLLAQVLEALAKRTGIDTALVDDVIMGCGSGTGDHAMDIARMAALDAGWDLDAPGVTLNRHCGSGQQAVNFAAMAVRSGDQDLVVAGGVESMSRPAPLHIDGFAANNAHLYARYPMIPQGVSADLLATLDGTSRRDCDELAVTSQRRAAAALAEGRFHRSVVPIQRDDGQLALDHDDLVRPDTTVEDLGRLAPSFTAMGRMRRDGDDRTYDEMAVAVHPAAGTVEHVHHAGNSSGIADGAAAIAVASPAFCAAHRLAPRARIVATGVAGSEPVLMFTAPGPATERVLAKAGMKVGDIDLFEVNEAFASVVLRWLRDTGADPDRVNVNGGAIALGHPIGATGAVLLLTVLDELERRDLSTGLVTMCTGGGMATATVIERL